MSTLNIAKESMASFITGHGTVDATPVQLFGISYEIRKHVVIRAAIGNTGTVSIGYASAQAANGFLLAAGEQTPPIYINDISKIWIVGSGTGQNYSFVGT